MNENELNTNALNLYVILGLFWKEGHGLMGLSMDPMVDLNFGCIYGLGPIPCTFYGLVRTLLGQGKPRQTRTFICFMSRH